MGNFESALDNAFDDVVALQTALKLIKSNGKIDDKQRADVLIVLEQCLRSRMKDAFIKALMSVRKKCYNAARSDIYEFIGNIYADDLYATYPCNDHDGFVAGVEAVKDELRKIIIDSNPTWASLN